MAPNEDADTGKPFNKTVYDKGTKIRETAVGTLGPFQERLDLASPDTTPDIIAPAASWSDNLLIYSVPSSYTYLVFYVIVSVDPLLAYSGASFFDFKMLRRPEGGVPDDDDIVGRSGFYNARSITYPAGEEFTAGESILISFRNIYSDPITFSYFIHGILER